MALEQMAEVQDRRLIGDGVAAKFETRERAHRLDVAEGFLGTRIAQFVTPLKAIDAKHRRQWERSAATLRAELGIVRLDQCLSFAHSTIAAISDKNTSRFVRFFFAA